MSPMFSPVHPQSSMKGSVNIPTPYQQNNRAPQSSFRHGGRPFPTHHLQPILPRPTPQSNSLPIQDTGKQAIKTIEPKVQDFYHRSSTIIQY